MNTALEQLDLTRQKASRTISSVTKSELGQYMTPSQIADFMVSVFTINGVTDIRVLDAGAGIGSLSIAFFERILIESKVSKVAWVGYEVDRNLAAYLNNHIDVYKSEFTSAGIQFSSELRTVDFVEDAVKHIIKDRKPKFNFAILNPPYKKINSNSRDRLLLRELKIETVNLYSAFFALVIDLLADGGQVVAIIPRSFCNGPYYKPFRERLLKKTAIRHIHLFDARDKAFSDEQVLQENIIILLERSSKQGQVKILKKYLRAMPENNTVPLIYPGHFSGSEIKWPKIGTKKPNALVLCDETKKWLYPNRFYVIVRRFSSKEERRRIVASIINPANFSLYDMLGFENHLNVFHLGKKGLSENISYGLSTYLNSTFVDQCFRRFSGHTQVNATDLRSLKYPSLNALNKLGNWAKKLPITTQESIDEALKKYGE